MPKQRKDPNKPKGVKSAYIFFVEKQRAEHEKNGEQISFAELSKKCGVLWADMDDEDKAPFVKHSEKDRKRYQNEMKDYVPQQNSDSDSDDDGGQQKKKKKKVKDPNAPKRPISAYFFFAADKRPEIRAKYPGCTVTEVASKIGAKWRDLDDEDKQPYEEQAAKDKDRYLRECTAYNKRK